jgi:hypothetical protein
MALTNKTIASTYGDILQADNSGSGRTANGTTIKDGLGQSTALTLGSNKVTITPSSDSTSAVTIENSSGTDLFVVDSTNSLIKVGTTQSYANTQIKEFGIFDFSPTADTHHPMVSMSGLSSVLASEWGSTASFGTGTDPATTLTITSGAKNITPVLWYVPVAITIDEVRVIASTDAADVLNFHLFSYAMATGTGSGAGDLSDGTLLAHNGSTLTTGDDRITTTTLTIDSANTAADRVILAFVENVGDTNDITAQLLVKYHYQ